MSEANASSIPPGTGLAEAADPADTIASADPTTEESGVQAPIPDAVLLAAVETARAALGEITPESTIGATVGHIVEGERVLSLLFECTLLGYPGWYWTVSLAHVDDDTPPSVLEAELMPGEHAVLAPDWVPWADRLADYEASQEAARAEKSAADSADESNEVSDEDEDDEDDDDEDDVGDDSDSDIDGVDIDELHEQQDESGYDGGDDDVDDDDDVDEEFESDDITGAELATLELEDDESDDAEPDSDEGRPHDPEAAGRDQGAGEDQ